MSILWNCKTLDDLENVNNQLTIKCLESNDFKIITIWLWYLTLSNPGGVSDQTPPWRYQLPFCGGCTNQFQISWFFPITFLLLYGKVIFYFFFVISTKKLLSKFLFALKKNKFLTKTVKTFFPQKYCHFLLQLCNQYALRNSLRCITCL